MLEYLVYFLHSVMHQINCKICIEMPCITSTVSLWHVGISGSKQCTLIIKVNRDKLNQIESSPMTTLAQKKPVFPLLNEIV